MMQSLDTKVAKLSPLHDVADTPDRYKYWLWLLATLSAVALGLTLLLDSQRPFWNDELFTVYIARQPAFHDVWKVLMTGAEQLPPLFFAITRASTSLLGQSRVAYRLPETLGFLLMSLCAFEFVRRRTSAPYGLLAFLFPFLTEAFYYAYEARPYGLVLGFCGLAAISWQATTEGRHRPLALVGVALSLACAVSCHYYAVLIFFPFAVAECIRLFKTRKLDLPVYVAIAAGFAPLFAFLPLIHAASGYASRFWSKPQWTMLFSFYEILLTRSDLALMIAVLLTGVLVWQRSARNLQSADTPVRLPAHEIALALGFTAIPIVAIFLAKLVTGAFTSRYAVYSVFGLAILLAWSFARMTHHSAAAGLAVTVAFFGCWLVIAMRQYRQFSADSVSEAQNFEFLASHSSPADPLVLASPHLFFVMSHHAESEGRGRFAYLADVPLAIKYTDTDTVERGLLAFRDFGGLNVQDFHAYAAAHPRFLVYGYPDPFGWVVQEMMRLGRPLTVQARNGQSLLFAVGPTASDVLAPASAK